MQKNKRVNSMVVFQKSLSKMDTQAWSIVDQVVEEFVKRSWIGSCLPASAMAARFIPEARVISGYAICREGGFRHHWVRIRTSTLHDGKAVSCDIDVAAEINHKLLKKQVVYVLCETICDGIHRFDQETEEEMRTSVEHERLVKTYYKNPVKFWKKALGWQRKWKPKKSCSIDASIQDNSS